MEIRTRAVTDDDREACVWVEAGATPGLRYINDTWEMFTSPGNGELIGAFVDGKLGGIGKLTRLYNGYGWLETLRVHPDYQGQGLGKAIYRRYMALMEEQGLKALGMYTNLDNDRSKGLAEKFGLSLRGRFSEFKSAPLARYHLDGVSACDFEAVGPGDGEAALSSYYKELGGYVVFNRTFYPVKEGLGRCLAENGWLYRDKTNPGNMLAAGSRFQPWLALHMAFYTGDGQRMLALAAALAEQSGAPGITVMRPYDGDNSFLLEKDFKRSAEDYITLWN